jgi:hypothetical protein
MPGLAQCRDSLMESAVMTEAGLALVRRHSDAH